MKFHLNKLGSRFMINFIKTNLCQINRLKHWFLDWNQGSTDRWQWCWCQIQHVGDFYNEKIGHQHLKQKLSPTSMYYIFSSIFGILGRDIGRFLENSSKIEHLVENWYSKNSRAWHRPISGKLVHISTKSVLNFSTLSKIAQIISS